ncbi:MAG: hypothetical protein J6B60_01865 [Clostridia bacterium]|nr:hypothetical protein [Clostridia bacterium]
MEIQYCVIKESYEKAEIKAVSYGICAYRIEDETLVVLESVHNITNDYCKICDLCDKCNEEHLEICHLKDVSEDFILA